MKRYQCGGNDMGDIIKINNDKVKSFLFSTLENDVKMWVDFIGSI